MSKQDANSTQHNPIFIVVMGVSGTGKSTLGAALGDKLGIPFVDGDDLHPRSNVEKMVRGQPLTDEDREPWLRVIRGTAERVGMEEKEQGSRGLRGVVVGCSALKRYYREILRGEAEVLSEPFPTYFVFIDGPREVLMDRMERRAGHFMKASMLDSQLATLESPVGEEGVVVVSLTDTMEEQVRIAVDGLYKFISKE